MLNCPGTILVTFSPHPINSQYIASWPPLMGTLQTPNPTLYPNRSPITNSHPNPNLNSVSDAKAPSYDDVSNFFSLPLSDAADSLGVCPSVLKKLCYENGLVRWPYRQILSGKSIEEIKKAAAIEKSKQLAELPNVAGPKNDALSSSPISSSIVSQLQNKSAGAQHEMPKFRTEISQNLQSSNMTKWNLDSLEEFKYGFPSNGLSTVTHRWWGNPSSNSNGRRNDNEEANECNQQSKENLAKKNDNEDAYESNQRSKEDLADDAVNLSPKDGEMSESKTNETEVDAQWTHLLSTLRKRAVKEGNQALKLGVYRGYGVNKLDQSKKMVLHQIFKSSLPNQWKDLSL